MTNQRISMKSSAIGELINLYQHQLRMSNLKSGELCLVVTDTAYNPIYAEAAMGAALSMGAEAYQIILPFNSPLPKKSLGAAMLEADLMVYSSTHTLHYAEETRQALNNGMRAMMSVQPLHAMLRMKGNTDVMRRSKEGAAMLGKADQIRITSDAGTNLTMKRGNRPAGALYGLADEPGHIDFFACAMVQTAPIEGTLEGTMILNTGDSMFYLGRYVDSPVKVTFKEGRVVDIEGGLDAFLMRKALESYQDDNAYRAGHIAWGTDHRANWLAQAFQYPEPGSSGADIESYYGNVQIEIGSNNDVAFQGEIECDAHLGHCMLDCNLYLDDELIIKKGQFVPEILR
ncbi:MAG: hypothetical protein JEZ06_06655 [Anaerolineaceae bacterium]|nr:hypothetical protein [Anaerolineaceae bacterium]